MTYFFVNVNAAFLPIDQVSFMTACQRYEKRYSNRLNRYRRPRSRNGRSGCLPSKQQIRIKKVGGGIKEGGKGGERLREDTAAFFFYFGGCCGALLLLLSRP